ncbi:hypothetical protein [Shewanella sp. WE21]|uniref:hypothetical protein n=1 Tax=Shewanella sp. WE21 TaxID=2029986 RepID=UPI001319DBAD|nr:hypothetical protein [Shewanella sp. WE21]
MHIDARYQPYLSPYHNKQLASVSLADTPTGKHGRIIGPSGTTRLGTGHHRPPVLADNCSALKMNVGIG